MVAAKLGARNCYVGGQTQMPKIFAGLVLVLCAVRLVILIKRFCKGK